MAFDELNFWFHNCIISVTALEAKLQAAQDNSAFLSTDVAPEETAETYVEPESKQLVTE